MTPRLICLLLTSGAACGLRTVKEAAEIGGFPGREQAFVPHERCAASRHACGAQPAGVGDAAQDPALHTAAAEGDSFLLAPLSLTSWSSWRAEHSRALLVTESPEHVSLPLGLPPSFPVLFALTALVALSMVLLLCGMRPTSHSGHQERPPGPNDIHAQPFYSPGLNSLQPMSPSMRNSHQVPLMNANGRWTGDAVYDASQYSQQYQMMPQKVMCRLPDGTSIPMQVVHVPQQQPLPVQGYTDPHAVHPQPPNMQTTNVQPAPSMQATNVHAPSMQTTNVDVQNGMQWSMVQGYQGAVMNPKVASSSLPPYRPVANGVLSDAVPHTTGPRMPHSGPGPQPVRVPHATPTTAQPSRNPTHWPISAPNVGGPRPHSLGGSSARSSLVGSARGPMSAVPTLPTAVPAPAHPQSPASCNLNAWLVQQAAVPPPPPETLDTSSVTMESPSSSPPSPSDRPPRAHDPAAELHAALDLLHETRQLFIGTYSLLSKAKRKGGGQGVVQLARNVETRREYAIKFYLQRQAFERERRLYLDQVLREMMPATQEVLSNSDGNIKVESTGFVFPPAIVIEKGESLQVWQKRERHDFITIMQVLCHIATRLQNLHEAGWVHRDLKPGNVLRRPEHHSWTLIDFGCSARIGTECGMAWCYGYSPPEIMQAVEESKRRVISDPAVDMWALGVIAYELLTKSRVFEAGTTRNHAFDCMLGRALLPWEGDTEESRRGRERLRGLKGSVMMCLQRDPRRRPTSRELLMIWNQMFDATVQTLTPEALERLRQNA